jgi:hypothetical protein
LFLKWSISLDIISINIKHNSHRNISLIL